MSFADSLRSPWNRDGEGEEPWVTFHSLTTSDGTSLRLSLDEASGSLVVEVHRVEGGTDKFVREGLDNLSVDADGTVQAHFDGRASEVFFLQVEPHVSVRSVHLRGDS